MARRGNARLSAVPAAWRTWSTCSWRRPPRGLASRLRSALAPRRRGGPHAGRGHRGPVRDRGAPGRRERLGYECAGACCPGRTLSPCRYRWEPLLHTLRTDAPGETHRDHSDAYSYADALDDWLGRSASAATPAQVRLCQHECSARISYDRSSRGIPRSAHSCRTWASAARFSTSKTAVACCPGRATPGTSSNSIESVPW